MQDGLAGSETMLWSYFWYEKLPLILGPQGFLKASRKWSDDGDFGRADVGHLPYFL